MPLYHKACLSLIFVKIEFINTKESIFLNGYMKVKCDYEQPFINSLSNNGYMPNMRFVFF